MIHILDNLWLNSLFGLAIILIITIINIVLARRKTLVVVLLDQCFFSLLAIILFGMPCVIYNSVCMAFVLFKKYWDRYRSDEAYLNYNEPIYSVSRVINLLNTKKDGDVIIGNIMPTNHTTIKNNMKPVRVTETILSGSMLVTGSTGSGKSTTMISILKPS